MENGNTPYPLVADFQTTYPEYAKMYDCKYLFKTIQHNVQLFDETGSEKPRLRRGRYHIMV